jgi:hypothetical protein
MKKFLIIFLVSMNAFALEIPDNYPLSLYTNRQCLDYKRDLKTKVLKRLPILDEKIEEADKSLLDFVTLHFDADNDISRQKFYQLQITTGSVRGDKIRLLDFYETRIKEECSK